MLRAATVLCAACGVLRGRSARAFLASPLRIPRSNDAHGRLGGVLSTTTMLGSTSDVRINKDVVVIGGGLAGLSTALELAKRGRQVTVLSRSRAEAAAEAAGGMIAPQAERLESGPYLDLCLASRAMYAEWVSSIEAIAGLGGDKSETHFWSCGGFMSPAFEGDAVHTWSPPPEGGQAHWVGRDQALEMEPSLSHDIVGAWWYPQDMSIDAQRMFKVLEQACSKAGVEILQGTSASSLVYGSKGSSVDAVLLEDGRRFHAKAVVSAAGAWMRELMPVPMLPHKGQMMALREPAGGRGAGAPRQGGGIGLTRVFFAEGCYIIPKRDGRIVVGSTVEVGEYGLHNTPAGIKQIIDAAIKVCPALADLAIERTWAGLRPVTPDTFPVLGASPRCPNLFVAGGYWRNGVLLAPKTSQLVADAVCGSVSPQDQVFSQAFAMDRFSVPEGGQPPRQSEPRQMPAAGRTQAPPSAKTLEMERAALERSNDGSMLSGLAGQFGKQPGGKTEGDTEVTLQPVEITPASSEAPQEPVNDYHASESFSESNLKEARMANRLVEEGSDARLEALFGDSPKEAAIPGIKAWEDGAEEVAKMLGAQIVEMGVDKPGGMAEEEMESQESPIFKVFWESPSGEDIEVPRGMNLGTMVEAGLISPMDVEGDDGETVAGGGGGAAVGVFDPTAVKGEEERSAEVSELYAKVMANKAKARATSEAGVATHDAANSAPTPNGHGASDESGGGAKRANSWIGGIFGLGGGSGIKETASTHEETGHDDRPGAHSGHEQQDMVTVGSSGATVPEAGGEEEVTEMVGYDFILQDRDDEEGKVARSARALSRDAPEGEAAWAAYEDIANAAMASVRDMESVQHLPP